MVLKTFTGSIAKLWVIHQSQLFKKRIKAKISGLKTDAYNGLLRTTMETIIGQGTRINGSCA
jgi:hypothetical protein